MSRLAVIFLAALLLALPGSTLLVVNDLDDSVRLAAVNLDGLAITPLAEVSFRGCGDGPVPGPSDFTCTVTEASDLKGNPVSAAACAVAVR